MNLTEEQIAQTRIVRISGRLDSTTAAGADAHLVERARTGSLIVDLSATTYLSSAGLRVLLKTLKVAKAAGHTLTIVALSPPVLEVFDISGFTALFTIRSSINEALP